MNRHLWREVRRQLGESGATGLVALLLVAVATTWGTAVWSVRSWVVGHLLATDRPAAIVAALRDPAGAERVREALASRFAGVSAEISSPAATKEQLAAWFPEMASVLLGLEDASFPTLLQVAAPTARAGEVATWLRDRPETILVENSRDWQARLERTLSGALLAGLGLAIALLLGCAVVVLLVVRLLVLEHADEIAIMRLIGARERDIRQPYLACGSLLGIGGGLIGIIAVLGLQLTLAPAGIPSPAPLTLAVLPATGATVGALGAAFGLASLPEEP